MCEVLFINPPFFRFLGSHNDRVPLGLGYLSSFLSEEGISNKILNTDATGASTYWPFTRLYNNFNYFVDAVDDKSMLYDEVVEIILSYNPKYVVLFGADPLLPTKDIGSPFITANLSKRLRKNGVFTIGFSPYYTMTPHLFKDDFDTIAVGEPSRKIVDIIKNEEKGIIHTGSLDIESIPNYSTLIEPDKNKTDMILTSIGCLFPCSFCIAGQHARKIGAKIRHIPTDIIVEDIKKNQKDNIYIGDLNFTYKSKKQLRELADALKSHSLNKTFTVEARADSLNEDILDLYKEIGITTIKVGIETFDFETQKNISKKHLIDHTFNIRKLAKEKGIKFISYVLVGGEIPLESYDYTYKILEELKPDNVVTSIWAFDTTKDYRYDTHFSPISLKRSGTPEEIYFKFLELAKSSNPTVGKILE